MGPCGAIKDAVQASLELAEGGPPKLNVPWKDVEGDASHFVAEVPKAEIREGSCMVDHVQTTRTATGMKSHGKGWANQGLGQHLVDNKLLFWPPKGAP